MLLERCDSDNLHLGACFLLACIGAHSQMLVPVWSSFELQRRCSLLACAVRAAQVHYVCWQHRPRGALFGCPCPHCWHAHQKFLFPRSEGYVLLRPCARLCCWALCSAWPAARPAWRKGGAQLVCLQGGSCQHWILQLSKNISYSLGISDHCLAALPCCVFVASCVCRVCVGAGTLRACSGWPGG